MYHTDPISFPTCPDFMSSESGPLIPRKSGDDSTEVRQPPLPPNYRISILCENDEILVVNKPYDIRIDGDFPITVEKLVRNGLSVPMDKFRLCNQLDYSTSGILVLGKTKSGARNCNKLFSSRKTSKYYLAIGNGKLQPNHEFGKAIKVTEKIAEIENDFRMTIDPQKGLESETLVYPIKTVGDNTLFLVQILTGRRHQIRLHLRHAGYPILGDATYGVRDVTTNRMMLHAWKLRLPFPNRTIIVTAPLGGDEGFPLTLTDEETTLLDSLSQN